MSTIKVKRTTGSSTPTGLTFGEPAYVQGIKSLYIGQTGGDPAIRVGAEVSIDGTLASNSDNKLPTEKAVKTYVDNSVAGGAVSTVNGATGAITIAAGSAIDVSTSGQTITVANQGVRSAVSGSGISVSGATGNVTFTNTGVTGLVAGTAISLSGSTGNITVTNTGVQSLAGTTNQITVSGSTGAVTISLPSDITTPGSLSVGTNLTVTGNLTVNGTTTTVNSDVMTVDDPIITLGLSGGLPLTVSDGSKDRGIAFSYYSATGTTGFFGFDLSAGAMIFNKNVTIASEVVTPTSDQWLPLHGGGLRIYDNFNGVYYGDIYVDALTISANRSYTLPDHTGTFVVPVNLGLTAGFILKSNGTGTQPTWFNANAAGFTAYAAGRLETARTIGLTGDVSGSASFDGTANINISTTIAPNSVALGTDTTGDYVAAVAVSGIGLSVAGSGENATYTVTSGATSNNVVSQIVARDASGNFSAGTITASLTGNASTASTLQTARNIGITGDVWGSASFNGSADISISATIQPNSIALGTDTTGNYIATLTTSSTGLTLSGSGVESAAMTVNLATITSGLNMELFTFASSEFINTSGTISIGVVDGGSY